MSDTAGSITGVIADDDADIRGLMSIAARKAGIIIVAAETNGTDALAAITRLAPTIAILDVSMPGLTGLEICSAVRSIPELGSVRLVLLSAAVDAKSVSLGHDAGADRYLLKPFSPKRLTAELLDALEVPT